MNRKKRSRKRKAQPIHGANYECIKPKTTLDLKTMARHEKLDPTQTVGISVPTGHIVVNSRWKNSNLVSDLKVSVPVHFEDSTSAIDFYPASHSGVIYVSEAETVEGHTYKRRMARLRKAIKVHGVVIAEKTTMSKQYFGNLQKFCVTDLGLDLIPVANQNEAAAFLIQMVYAETSLNRNPFVKIPKSPCKDTALLGAICKCPGIGETKSLAILNKFPSLIKLCQASQEDLTLVLGKASAANLYKFLHGLSPNS